MGLQRKTELKRGGELKRSPIKRKRATPRTRKTVARCAWSNRCTETRLSVVVSLKEAYCHTHGVAVLDDLVRAFVKRRDGRCLRCGRKPPEVVLHWSHLISRGAPYLRWDLENSVAHCAGCHYHLTVKASAMELWIEQWQPGLKQKLTRREAAAEARGGHLPIAVLIRRFRRLEAA